MTVAVYLACAGVLACVVAVRLHEMERARQQLARNDNDHRLPAVAVGDTGAAGVQDQTCAPENLDHVDPTASSRGRHA